MLLLLCRDIETQPGPESLTKDEFQRQFLSKKGIKIIHQNIRGLTYNFNMLQEFLASHDHIDIVPLSETHLTENSLISLCEIDCYKMIRRNRTVGKGGVVAMYLIDNITFKRRYDLENLLLENIWIEIIQKHSKPFLIDCFYRPPETSLMSQDVCHDKSEFIGIVSNYFLLL